MLNQIGDSIIEKEAEDSFGMKPEDIIAHPIEDPKPDENKGEGDETPPESKQADSDAKDEGKPKGATDQPTPEEKPTPDKTFLDAADTDIIKVKVNGEEIEVPYAEFKSGFQKNASADQRLKDANKARKDLDDREVAFKAQQDAFDKKVADAVKLPPEEKAAPTPDVDLKTITKEWHDAIYAGDEEKAVELSLKMQDAMAATFTPETPPTDSDPIDATAVKNEVMAEIRQEQAIDVFRKEYEDDILKDPYLTAAADVAFAKQVKEGVPFGEALMASGEEVRKWHKAMGASEKPEAIPDVDTSKAEKKEAIDNIKTVGDKSASAAAAEKPPMTPSQVINEMRKARGQQAVTFQ
jgi:hypothetical protein